MKINERTLVAFATSRDSGVDKSGWLWKKGEVNRSFRKRWFVLKGNLLFYFEKQTDKEPLGVIILEGCVIELAEEDQERFGFKISFQGERTRVYHLGTEFQQTLVEWMQILAVASHDYMKVMVFELEQKLIELENMEMEQNRKKLQQLQAAAAASASSKTNSMPASRSANAISSITSQHSAKKNNMMHQSASSHSLRSTTLPAAASTTASMTAGSNRPNPFNSSTASTVDGFNMPPFDPAAAATAAGTADRTAEQQTAVAPAAVGRPVEEAREVLAPHYVNRWAKYHHTVGRKIVADQNKWYQNYCSKHQLVKIGVAGRQT